MSSVSTFTDVIDLPGMTPAGCVGEQALPGLSMAAEQTELERNQDQLRFDLPAASHGNSSATSNLVNTKLLSWHMRANLRIALACAVIAAALGWLVASQLVTVGALCYAGGHVVSYTLTRLALQQSLER